MKILELDIETAPNKAYVWGLYGQNIGINQIVEPGYTMCWAAKWYGKKPIMFNSIHKSSKDEMLEEMWLLMDEADAIIHYNGDKFDIPILNWEFLKHRFEPPKPSHHIDLLKVMRNRFKLASRKLDYVSQQLGLGAKTQHMGMDLWDLCMKGDDKAWKLMEKYNKQDVKLLEDLYEELLPWIKNHPNHALFMDNQSKPVCPNCGSTHLHKKGIETTLTQQYQRYRCVDCGTPLRGRTNITPKEMRGTILTQSKL